MVINVTGAYRSLVLPCLLKIPDLTGPLGAGITGQILVGSAASFVCAYLSVRFLERYFRTRTLIPFAIYSLTVGAGALIWLSAG